MAFWSKNGKIPIALHHPLLWKFLPKKTCEKYTFLMKQKMPAVQRESIPSNMRILSREYANIYRANQNCFATSVIRYGLLQYLKPAEIGGCIAGGKGRYCKLIDGFQLTSYVYIFYYCAGAGRQLLQIVCWALSEKIGKQSLFCSAYPREKNTSVLTLHFETL